MSHGTFPVLSTHYGLTYRQLMTEAFQPAVLADTRPYDCVLCTTTAARQAASSLLDRASVGLSARFGRDVRFQGRLELLPCGVYSSDYARVCRSASRERLQLPKNGTIVLFAGRLTNFDKLDPIPLLPLMARLMSEHRGKFLFFLFVGNPLPGFAEGFLSMVRQSKLNKNVHLVPGVDRRQLAEYYSAADIFWSLGDAIENFGLTTVEAMASGLPVVVPDLGGYKDTVRHGVTGFRVRTRWMKCDDLINQIGPMVHWSVDHHLLGQSIAVDMDEAFEYMHRLIKDPELRRTMGQAGVEHVRRSYDWEVVLKRYWEIIEDLCDHAARCPVEPRPMDYLMADYFHCFSHCVSEVLEHTDAVAITPIGVHVLRSGQIPLVHKDMQMFFSRPGLEEMLRWLSEAGEGGLAMPELHSRLKDRTVQDAVVFHMHVMWLMKYGLIRPVRGPNEGAATAGAGIVTP